MAKIQDIDIPYLEFAEAAAPGTPASGIVRIYAKSDGSLYQKDDAGTETGLAGGGGGGSVATDTIWDAAGDLAVGTGADTAARLAKGSAGAELGLSNGSVAWTAGTSFPGSPATGDRYYRTDRHLEYFYDGTRWLTVHEYTASAVQRDGNWPLTANGNNGHISIDQGANGIYIVRIAASTTTLATNNGSNYWTTQWTYMTSAGGTGNVGSSYNTSADTASATVSHIVTVDAVMGGTVTGIYAAHTKTGSPGNYYMWPAVVTWRFVG